MQDTAFGYSEGPINGRASYRRLPIGAVVGQEDRPARAVLDMAANSLEATDILDEVVPTNVLRTLIGKPKFFAAKLN